MNWTDNESNLPDSGEPRSDMKFRVYQGIKSRTWYVGECENPADHIFVGGDKDSQGFEGRTLKFKDVDDTIHEVQGPRRSNSAALLAYTGIDVTEMYLTFGVIGFDVEYGTGGGMHPVTIKDVQYKDEHWTLGFFDRVRDIAQQIANEKNRVVYCFNKSKSGSSCGPVKPEKVDEVNSINSK